jgi:hypothetical protein
LTAFKELNVKNLILREIVEAGADLMAKITIK